MPVGRVMGVEYNRSDLNGSGRSPSAPAPSPARPTVAFEDPAKIAGRFAARSAPASAAAPTGPSPEPATGDQLSEHRPESHRRPPDRRLTLGGLALILFAAVTLFVAIQMSGYFERSATPPKRPANGLAAQGTLR